jgi:hypothetical protein
LASAQIDHSPAGQHGLERNGFAQGPAQELADGADQLVGVDRFWRQRLQTREREQPVGQRDGALCPVQRHLSGARDARRGGRGAEGGNVPADRVEPAQYDREQVVEVVRDAAGELADRLHLLRLAQQLLGLSARIVLRLELARALLDAILQCLGEGAQLGQCPLSVRNVDIDSDHADGTALGVVDDDAARLHPF